MSIYLPRLAKKKPPELIENPKGSYRLEGKVREAISAKYGKTPSRVHVEKILTDLAGQIANIDERVYYQEVLICYQHEARRAATVMMWNLAYDHFLNWIMADSQRLANFNTALPKRIGGSKGNLTVAKNEGFSRLTEAEVIGICNTGNVISVNLNKVLEEKLKRRNMAAHPAETIIGQTQVNDVIEDLARNVLLALPVS